MSTRICSVSVLDTCLRTLKEYRLNSGNILYVNNVNNLTELSLLNLGIVESRRRVCSHRSFTFSAIAELLLALSLESRERSTSSEWTTR